MNPIFEPIHALLLLAYTCTATAASDSDLRPDLVERQSLIVVGTVESESAVRRLSFGQTGRITRIDTKEGDRVRRGQLLASIDCTDANAALAIAEAELDLQRLSFQRRTRPPEPTELQAAKDRLALAEEDLRIAEATRTRMESLSQDRNLISKYELGAASRREQVARLDVSIAQQALHRLQTPVLPEDEQENSAREKLSAANIARARYQASLCNISAPVSGTVVEVHRSPGEMAIAAEPIIHIAEDGDRLALFCIPALNEQYPRVGQEIRLQLPVLRDTTFSGVVVRVTSPASTCVNVQNSQFCSAPCAVQAWVTSPEQLSAASLRSIVYAYFD